MSLIKVIEKPERKISKKKRLNIKRKRDRYDSCLKNEQAWLELYQKIWLYQELHDPKSYIPNSVKLKHKSEMHHIRCVIMHIKAAQPGIGRAKGIVWNKIKNLGWCGECEVYVNIKDRSCICCGMQYRRNPHQKSHIASPKQNEIRAKHEIDI